MYTFDELYNKRLTDLRQYARKIGVKNATSLKKRELMEQIIGVQNGTIVPHFSKSGRRPLDELGSYTEIAAKTYKSKINADMLNSFAQTVCGSQNAEFTLNFADDLLSAALNAVHNLKQNLNIFVQNEEYDKFPIKALFPKSVTELRAIAEDLGIDCTYMNKFDLIKNILFFKNK